MGLPWRRQQISLPPLLLVLRPWCMGSSQADGPSNTHLCAPLRLSLETRDSHGQQEDPKQGCVH